MTKKRTSPKPTYKDQITALSQISKAISSDLYLDDVLKLIVATTANILKSNICSLQLINEKTGELIIRATQSVSEEYNKKPPLKIGEGISGKAAQMNKPIAIKDIAKEKEYKFRDIAKKEKLSSLLCIPLNVKGKVIGVINLYTAKPHDFKKPEIELISSIATLAAVAIENAELVVKFNSLREELVSRKALDRAKGILMRDEGLTEEKAYLKIQKYAMDTRKSMREVSEAIILSTDIKKQ